MNFNILILKYFHESNIKTKINQVQMNFKQEVPIFKRRERPVKFFMPHFPIFTGSELSDLEKVKFLLSEFGQPQNRLKNVIHVVGTNGKGSSCAYLKTILMEQGYRVNTYTSPHLHAVNERINLNGFEISDENLFCHTEKIRFVCEKHKIGLTIFESLTIVALLEFATSNADFNIFEAGMGGEFDATNVFDQQNILGVLITSISYDHTKFLGNSLTEIATAKLGVIKPYKPVVMQPFNKEVLQAVVCKLEQTPAIPFFFGRDYNFCKVEFLGGEQALEFSFGGQQIVVPLPSLLGEHQIYNLVGVLAFICACKIEVFEQALIYGILKTKWAGRLEAILEEKYLELLPSESEIWFDGAHNEGGAKALANWLSLQPEGFVNVLLLSKTRGSEVIKFIELFQNLVEFGVALKGQGEIYPEFQSILEEGFAKNNILCARAKNILEALKKITETFPAKKIRIIIAGSLYLAREI